MFVDDDEAGPTGDGDDDDDDDDEDDEGSDGDDVGLSYLMKDGIQVSGRAALCRDWPLRGTGSDVMGPTSRLILGCV